MIALIDGDILVYECGFSSDANAKKEYLEAHLAKHKEQLRPEELEEYLDAREPVEYALKIVKNKLAELIEMVEADSFEIYITGDDNYRMEILPDYKANRDPTHKPHWYKEIKEYLINFQGAIVVEGIEADDILGIRQCEETDDWTCICSKDKDLDCIPGWHYNWSPSKVELGVYWVEEVEALRFFYTQCLTGDTTDNIPGIFKLTGKKATKKLKEPLQRMYTELEMYNHVKEAYGDVDFHPTAG